MCQIYYIKGKYFFLSIFEHCRCHIIYVKSNSKAVYKKQKGFPSKFAKIEDLKVDYMYSKQNVLNLSIILRIHQLYYRISYTKNHGFGNLVVFSSGQL